MGSRSIPIERQNWGFTDSLGHKKNAPRLLPRRQLCSSHLTYPQYVRAPSSKPERLVTSQSRTIQKALPIFNKPVTLPLYIDFSEMSIVGPPPTNGWRFFCPDFGAPTNLRALIVGRVMSQSVTGSCSRRFPAGKRNRICNPPSGHHFPTTKIRSLAFLHKPNQKPTPEIKRSPQDSSQGLYTHYAYSLISLAFDLQTIGASRYPDIINPHWIETGTGRRPRERQVKVMPPIFNKPVTLPLYIDFSEMSIVGPPPSTHFVGTRVAFFFAQISVLPPTYEHSSLAE
jgi:hypothetical protein